MPRKKSPAQLEREIAEALAKRKQLSTNAADSFAAGFRTVLRGSSLKYEGWPELGPGTSTRRSTLQKVKAQILPNRSYAFAEGARTAEALLMGSDDVARKGKRYGLSADQIAALESEARASVGHATMKADRGESYASVHRKASREADRTLLNRALNEIYDAMYVVAAGPKIYMYGSKDDAQEFMRGLPRYAEGKLLEIRSITAKEQQDLARKKRQAYRNP